MEWKTLVNDLLESGMTQTEIASNVGTLQSTISRMKAGKHPNVAYPVGSKLIALHASRINRKNVA